MLSKQPNVFYHRENLINHSTLISLKKSLEQIFLETVKSPFFSMSLHLIMKMMRSLNFYNISC